MATVGVREHDEHLLGEAVRGVGILGIARPEIGLLERNGQDLRVRANGVGGHELLDAGSPRLLEDVQAHGQVVVHQGRGVRAIEADASDARSQVEYAARSFHSGACIALEAQVVVGGADDAYLGAERRDLADERLAEEAGTPGHRDGSAVPEVGIRQEHHSEVRTARPASWSSRLFTSASTMSRTSSVKVAVGLHPSLLSAFGASPRSASTSAGRR